MSTTMQDTIQKEMILRAPIERVYAALTDPEQFAKWFPDSIEGELKPGERPLLDFGEYGKCRIYVVAAEPFTYFAYRWVSGSAYAPHGFQGDVLTMPNTLVEFRLESGPEGTRLKLTESGMASLPPEIAELTLKDNDGGWDYMLGRLHTYLDKD